MSSDVWMWEIYQVHPIITMYGVTLVTCTLTITTFCNNPNHLNVSLVTKASMPNN